MKLAVIGANGMVGSRVIAEALSRNIEVDGYSRSGKAPEGAQGFAVDLQNTQSVVDVIDSHDATVIASAGRDLANETMIEIHRNLIAAAPKGRFIVVGGAGALDVGAGMRLYDTEDFPAEYLDEAKKFGVVLDEYRKNAGSLQWTMLAPSPVIAPGVRTGEYRTELNTVAGFFVSAEDFAVALVDEAEKAEHVGERFTAASVDAEAAQGK